MSVDSQSRLARRRSEYLQRQKEEAERAHARMLIQRAEKVAAEFAQDQRRSSRTTMRHTLEEQLRAKGLVK